MDLAQLESGEMLTQGPRDEGDNGLLEERLQLLARQREMAALHCQKFTDYLEAYVAQQSQESMETPKQQRRRRRASKEAGEECYWSAPCASPGRGSDSEADPSELTHAGFPARLYYEQASRPRRHSAPEGRRRQRQLRTAASG